MSSPDRPAMHPTPSGTSSGASSLAQPSPLTPSGPLGLPGVPQIVEDEDSYEDRPPLITVEDEQIDEFPFDPSIPDEMLFQQDAYANDGYNNDRRPLAARTVAPPAHTLQTRLSRLLPSPSSILPSPSIPSMPSVHAHMHGRDEAESESFAHRLVARFHRRRGERGGEGGSDGSGGGGVEPGVLLSTRSPAAAKMRLVPLAEAQGRPDIANRPEGFELAEAKMRGAP